jgi:hypothetical protein
VEHLPVGGPSIKGNERGGTDVPFVVREFRFEVQQIIEQIQPRIATKLLFVASPWRGEMFIAGRSFLYSGAPKERNRFCIPRGGDAP